MLVYIKTSEHISLNINGHPRLIAKDHVNYDEVLRLIQKHTADLDAGNDAGARKIEEELLTAVDVSQFVEKWSEGAVRVGETGVLLHNKPVNTLLTERIMAFLQAGEDFRPLARFMERCAKNPNTEAVNDLYAWIEKHRMPLTSDGRFIAYKMVGNEFQSLWGGATSVENVPGTRVTMAREDCDPDRNQTCSTGLHWCSFGYLNNYGTGGGNRVVLVAVCPSDVTAIPLDYNLEKGRSCAYDVLYEVPREECEHLFLNRVVLRDADEDYDDDVLDEEYWDAYRETDEGNNDDDAAESETEADRVSREAEERQIAAERDATEHEGVDPWAENSDPRHDYDEVVDKELQDYQENKVELKVSQPATLSFWEQFWRK